MNNPLEYAILIEAIATTAYGVIRGGVETRRFIAVGIALALAYYLPNILSLAPPGSPTYLILYREVEGMIQGWSAVYEATAYAGLAWAIGMTILNIIATISTLGIGALPIQAFSILESMGHLIDPIADIVFAVIHASQVMIAVLHTIAYLAWFSYAIAPVVIGIAVVLMAMGRTRAAGVALLILTLTILFITTIAAHDAMAAARAQLLNETEALMNWLRNNSPSTAVRGFLILNSPYPYLVSGVLYGIKYTIIGRSVMPIEYPASTFTAFTGSITPINAFGIPQISNVTFLWLSINPSHYCVLLTYINNQSTEEPCNLGYLGSNSTYAEAISFDPPPFNAITAILNGTTTYTGAWEWLNPPNQYTAGTSNNTVTLHFTMNVPPGHCLNTTNPRTGITHRTCYPGTAEASLWLFASNALINLPSRAGNATECQYQVLNNTLYREVSIAGGEDALRQLINKLNEEVTLGRLMTGMGRNISLAMPSPEPAGYWQGEVEITCVNYSNETAIVNGAITVFGNAGNPWFGHDPIGLTPSTSWVINSVVIGSQELLSGWAYFRGLLAAIGYFIPKWLAESVIIFGLLDGAMWLAGFPTMMAPAWSILSGVIYDLSLVLYMRIGGMSKVLNRLSRRVRRGVNARVSRLREAVGMRVRRHGRLSRVMSTLARARHELVISTRQFMSSPAVARLARYAKSPTRAVLEDAESILRSKAIIYEERGMAKTARLAKASALIARGVMEYPRLRSLGERGRLYEATGLRLWGGAEMDRRALTHGTEKHSTDPLHLVRRSNLRRMTISRTINEVENAINTSLTPPMPMATTKDTQEVLRRITGRLREVVTTLDMVRLVAASMAPHVRRLHRESTGGMKRLSDAKSAIQGLVHGDLDAVPEIANALGIEYIRARELLSNAINKRVEQALPRYMGDREVLAQAVREVKPIIDELIKLRNGIALSHDTLKPLINNLKDDAGAVEAINNWWVRHVRELGNAINGNAGDEELMRINARSVSELARNLMPRIMARYRQALEEGAREVAAREVLPIAIGDFLRTVGYGEWAREQLGRYREYQLFMREYGKLLREGPSALVGRAFSEAYPRIAEIARNDLIVDRAVTLYLGASLLGGDVDELIGGGRKTIRELLDKADSQRMTPLTTLLHYLTELGVDLNEAIDWRALEELYTRLEANPMELRQVLRAFKALWEEDFIDIDGIEEVAPGIAAKVIHTLGRRESFTEYHRDLWRSVMESEAARLVGRDELVTVRHLDDDKLEQLLRKYMPPGLLVKVLGQVRDYVDNELDAVLNRAKHDLETLSEPIRLELERRRGEFENARQASDYGKMRELVREINELVSGLGPYDEVLRAIGNAINALTSGGIDEFMRARLLREYADRLRDLVALHDNTVFREMDELRVNVLRAANHMDALAITTSLIETLRQYEQSQGQPQNPRPNKQSSNQ